MTDHPQDDPNVDEAPADAPERVRVPTSNGPGGPAEYVEADPDVAWQWDARRWERLS